MGRKMEMPKEMEMKRGEMEIAESIEIKRLRNVQKNKRQEFLC